MNFEVFSTVHHSIELFHQPTLMQNCLYSLTICLLLLHVEDNSVTNILLMNKEKCALKLVDEINLKCF